MHELTLLDLLPLRINGSANFKLVKTKFLITITLLSVVAHSFAQIPSWIFAKSTGGISNDYSNATCTDANGNVYITGTFQSSTITFGTYTLYNSATGSLDIFVVKYDANGNVLWAVSAGGTSYDYGYGICTDANDNVCITGYFNSPSITFGAITLSNTYCADVFVTKFDSSGNVLWAKSAHGTRSDYAFSICSDANNNIYITGMFDSSPIIFGNDTVNNVDRFDIFIVKYDAGGNVIWAKGEGGIQSDAGLSISSDINANIYITGYFQSMAFFGNDTLIGNGNSNIFIAKYNSNGIKLWVKTPIVPGSSNNSAGTGVAVEAGGNVYITGYFQSSVAFGNDTLANAGSYGIFLAKYDSVGNALWGKNPGGTNNDVGQAICIDINGNVFITGYFASSFLNFGGNPVFNANIGYDDIFVASYDASGNALWAKSVGDQDNDYGTSICSAGNSVYVTGYFGSYSLDFGGIIITNAGSNDVFLAKLGSSTGIEENNSLEWEIFPNPISNHFHIALSTQIINGKIEIFSQLGEKVFSVPIKNEIKMEINLKDIADGVYFLKVFDGEKNYCKKIIVKHD